MLQLIKNSIGRVLSAPLGGSAAVLLTVLAYFALLYDLGYRSPVHMDTVRDLLMARDCLNGYGCSSGIPSSFGGFIQGSGAFIRFMAAAAQLGISSNGITLVFYVIYALAVAVFFLIMRRYMTAGKALVCSGIYLVLTLKTHELPILDNPLFSTPFALLCFWSLLKFNEKPSVIYLLFVSAALGLCIDTHVVYLLLVPVAAAFFAVRPTGGRLYSVTAYFLTLLVVDGLLAWGPFGENVVTALVTGYAFIGAAVAAVFVLFFRWKKRSVVEDPFFLPAVIAVYGCTIFLLVGAINDQGFMMRYLMPAACYLSMTLPYLFNVILDRVTLHSGSRGSFVQKARVVFLFWIVMTVAIDIVITLAEAVRFDKWLVSDYEAVARHLYKEKNICYGDVLEQVGMVSGSFAYYRFFNLLPAFTPADKMGCENEGPGSRYLVVKTRPGGMESFCGVRLDYFKPEMIPLSEDLYLIEKKAWLDRDEFKACLEVEKGGKKERRCETLTDDDVLPLKPFGMKNGGVIVYGDMPYRTIDRLSSVMDEMTDGAGVSQNIKIEYIFKVSVPQKVKRRMFILCSDGDERDPVWRFGNIEGINYNVISDSVVEIAGGGQDGVLHVEADLKKDKHYYTDFPFPNIFSFILD